MLYEVKSEISMFMYDTRRFCTKYYSLALLHMIALESQDVQSGNYGIRMGGLSVLLTFGKNKSVHL